MLTGLHHLRTQVIVVSLLAGVLFPPWLTAFAYDHTNGMHWLWIFVLFNTFSSNECIRLGYMPLDHPNVTAHQASCDKTYHDFANLSLRLHAPLLLLVANLCIVFLFQLGGWSLDQCAKRRGVREAILTLLTGAVFLLPLVPVTVLSANGAMRIFTSLVIPMCFAAVLPLRY